MLEPKRVKWRKPHLASYEGKPKGNTYIAFGEMGLVAKQGAWITAKQIEAARIAISKHLGKTGKMWIRIFPHMGSCLLYTSPGRARQGSTRNPHWVGGGAVSYTHLSKYTFAVLKDANKGEIKEAFREIFKINPIKINIINMKPQLTKTGTKFPSITPFLKKAIITLPPGTQLNLTGDENLTETKDEAAEVKVEEKKPVEEVKKAKSEKITKQKADSAEKKTDAPKAKIAKEKPKAETEEKKIAKPKPATKKKATE